VRVDAPDSRAVLSWPAGHGPRVLVVDIESAGRGSWSSTRAKQQQASSPGSTVSAIWGEVIVQANRTL
jgi:hypothetical protein